MSSQRPGRERPGRERPGSQRVGRQRFGRWAVGLPLVVTVVLAGACAAPPTLTPQQQVDQIVQFVETARGHEFVTTPTVQFLSDAAFRADVLAGLDAAEAGVDADDVAFTAAGWIRPDQDLFQLYRIAFGGGVVGFYDPVTKVLKVRGTDLTPYRREVIAHELTHALDDQVHGLDDLTGVGLVDEQYLAALVAIEGSAVKVQQRYIDSMSDLERFQDLAEQLELGSDPALLEVPIALLTLTSAPYVRGATFQEDLIGRLGNPAGPDLSLTRYPASTEQAFSTDAYLADEPTQAVAVPPADGPAVRSGAWGQFLLTLLLREGLALDTVDAATQGWAGDAYVTWTAGSQSCLRLDTRMDDQARADALRAALVGWSGRHPGATVTDLGGSTVRLTACSG